MLQKNWENCKENKGNTKVQTRSQDNTLTIRTFSICEMIKRIPSLFLSVHKVHEINLYRKMT